MQGAIQVLGFYFLLYNCPNPKYKWLVFTANTGQVYRCPCVV